ncbi:HAD family hydrolase [Williamsia herbipolensis]|uniref:HAD-IA family hydrolase n=1 Tax=Williamsia herbipolensis TaxID=1603258 RepID=A0AAU4K4L7_9NOCA|nr:HAD-IA family hydrolase [Williamsia herbipolensis]
MPAILFGSISTLADTSELQRQAFNQAFAEHDLDWTWTRDDYIGMLGSNGGADRIAEYASAHGDDVDAAAVHATKSRIFQTLIGDAGLQPRQGVVETVQAAKSDGVKLGFVTTTSRENITALLDALAPAISADTFDIIVDSDSVETPKPDAAAYRFALAELGEQAGHAVAIEDNEGGVASAGAADVRCIAFPNENTADGDFGSAVEVVEVLDSARVRELAAGTA